jgi:hypothetical protein
MKEEFEDTKGAIRICISKKNTFEYLKRVCSISTILNPSSTPSCIAQFPTCSDNPFNTSSSGIRCSAMLSIPIKADLFH